MKLGVNIDHIASIRQIRNGIEPDPVFAAFLAQAAGADSIVVHLREDRRHIKDRDLYLLKETVRTKLNLEMSMPMECNPSSKHWTSVVPDPAKGSRIMSLG